MRWQRVTTRVSELSTWKICPRYLESCAALVPSPVCEVRMGASRSICAKRPVKLHRSRGTDGYLEVPARLQSGWGSSGAVFHDRRACPILCSGPSFPLRPKPPAITNTCQIGYAPDLRFCLQPIFLQRALEQSSRHTCGCYLMVFVGADVDTRCVIGAGRRGHDDGGTGCSGGWQLGQQPLCLRARLWSHPRPNRGLPFPLTPPWQPSFSLLTFAS